MIDTPRCEHCNGPLWVPPHSTAGYQASVPCECIDVGRAEIEARIELAKREGRWA